MLYITGTIGKDTTAEGVARWLAANGDKPFTVFFDSDGGDMREAMKIDEMLAKAPVVKAEIKWAASAASYIAVGIKDRQLAAGVEQGEDVIMIHNPRITTLPGEAEADDLRAYAAQLDEFTDLMSDRYAASLGISKEAAMKLMAKEAWLDPSAARQLNILAFTTKTPDEMSAQKLLDEIYAVLGIKPQATVVAQATPPATEPAASVDEGKVELSMDELKAMLDAEKEKVAAAEAKAAQYKAMCDEYEAKAKAEAGQMEEVLAEVKALKAKVSKAEVIAKANPKPTATPAPDRPLAQWELIEQKRKEIGLA